NVGGGGGRLGRAAGATPRSPPRCPEAFRVREKVLQEGGAERPLDLRGRGENSGTEPSEPLGNGAGQPQGPFAVLLEDSHLEGGEKVTGDGHLGHFGFPRIGPVT